VAGAGTARAGRAAADFGGAGSLALLSGPAVLDVEAVGPGDWGLWLGLGLSVALIVAGSALARNVLLGIGAAGGNGTPR
jgi:hypothetical protein